MELSNTAMTDRQIRFLENYRNNIEGWYNGWLHVAIIYSIGIGLFSIFIANMEHILWWEWLTIPIVGIACNFFEWFLHRHIMHRPSKNPLFKAIYTRHTLNHHQFFTEKDMRFASSGDWRVTFFPPYALVVFTIMSVQRALVVGLSISGNAGWLLISTTIGMYLIYEFMHFCCHVEEGSFVKYCPLVNTLRRHHTAHHSHSIMMEKNMNLTFPISDWLFGTSDLKRGLMGHLFNGYNNKHVKAGLRHTAHTPKGTLGGRTS